MSRDGDLGVDDATDEVGPFLAAFDFYCLRAPFFDEACGIAHGFVRADVVGAERHVGYQQGIFHGAPDSLGVVQHLVNGDRECVVISEHGLGQRIADQDDVDASLVNQACGGIVVCGQAGDGLAMKYLFAQRCNGDFLARFANRGETHCILQCPSASGG